MRLGHRAGLSTEKRRRLLEGEAFPKAISRGIKQRKWCPQKLGTRKQTFGDWVGKSCMAGHRKVGKSSG